MKAVIMAGGEGTRLRPLTCDCPKPMARLCGRPMLEYILDLLVKNGINEVSMTLRYLPQVIRDHFEDSSYRGMKLEFFEESEPLGTAGGVKNAAGNSPDGIIVLSGDALCDFDLAAAIRFHHEKKAAATIVTTHVADPREYGLVVAEPSGLIRGFVEKPGWTQSVTDAVNSGVYILSPDTVSLIPDGRSYDFAKDLFSLMLSKNMPLYSFDADGYWCDIGDIGAYVSCQFEMLEGKIDCALPGFRQGSIYYKSSLPTGNYTLLPPVYVGENVKIADYAQVGPFAVIDDGCTIGTGATVKNSVLLRDVFIGERCELRGALVCAGASLKKRAGMFEGSVAGAGSVIGRDASVSPGVKIWPGKQVEDEARVAVNLKFGAARKGVFDDDGITGEVGIDLTPEMCAKLGAATGEGSRRGIGTAYDGSNAGLALINAASSGVISTGAQVINFGGCFEAMFSFAVPFLGLDMGIFARTAGSRAVLRLIDGSGLTLTRSQERRIEAAVATGEIGRCEASKYSSPYSMTGISAIYAAQLPALAPDGLSGINACVKSSNRGVQHMLDSALKALDCGEGGIKVHITASGGAASFFDENGDYINASRTLALGCVIRFAQGEDVALPYETPRAIDFLAAKYSKKVLRYLSCPVDGADKPARLLATSQPWVRDGLQNAVSILYYLCRNNLKLCDFAASLPPFELAVKAISIAGNPGHLLKNLSSLGERQEGPHEGVLIAERGGRVLLSPLKRGRGLRIMAEAASMEAADELCAEFEKRLQKLE